MFFAEGWTFWIFIDDTGQVIFILHIYPSGINVFFIPVFNDFSYLLEWREFYGGNTSI